MTTRRVRSEHRSRTQRRLGEWLPDAFGSLFVLFLAQTLAITAFTSVFERSIGNWPSAAVISVGAALLLLTFCSYAWRERVRKTGTAVAIIVKRQRDDWESIKEAAARYQHQNRYRYWYPLVEQRPLPMPSGTPANGADWSDQFESCRGMLSMIFDDSHGAPVDLRRIAVMINTPLPLAFQLGASWVDIVRNTAQLALIQLRDVSGNVDDPIEVWRSHRFDRPRRTTVDTECDLLVVRTVERFEEDWLESLGPYRLIGRPMHITSDSQSDIDDLLDEVASHVAGADPQRQVRLILATTAPVAFALGMGLRGFRDRVSLLEYSGTPNVGYFDVHFRRRNNRP